MGVSHDVIALRSNLQEWGRQRQMQFNTKCSTILYAGKGHSISTFNLRTSHFSIRFKYFILSAVLTYFRRIWYTVAHSLHRPLTNYITLRHSQGEECCIQPYTTGSYTHPGPAKPHVPKITEVEAFRRIGKLGRKMQDFTCCLGDLVDLLLGSCLGSPCFLFV